MSLRAPISRACGLGASGKGLHHWTMQRLTAIALAPLVLWFVFSLAHMIGADYAAVTTWLRKTTNAVLVLLLIFALYLHAALGVQTIIEDYMTSKWQKLIGLIMVRFLAWFAGLASTLAVLKVYLGYS